MDAAMLTRIIDAGYKNRYNMYVAISSIAFAVVDSMACFEDEVTHIWKTKWHPVKLLYLLARSLIFLNGGVMIIMLSVDLGSAAECSTYFSMNSTLTTLQLSVGEAILYVRVYALSGQSRVMGAMLGTIYFGLQAGILANLIRFLQSLEHVLSPIPNVLACLLKSLKSHILASNFIIVLCSKTFILGLTLWLGITRHRETKSSLVTVFYRDGMYYFLALSVLSAGNILCAYVAPPEYMYLLSVPQGMAHSILATRMVLHIRKVGSTGKVVGSNDLRMNPMGNSLTFGSVGNSLTFGSVGNSLTFGSVDSMKVETMRFA